jgi:hypothetical protein
MPLIPPETAMPEQCGTLRQREPGERAAPARTAGLPSRVLAMRMGETRRSAIRQLLSLGGAVAATVVSAGCGLERRWATTPLASAGALVTNQNASAARLQARPRVGAPPLVDNEFLYIFDFGDEWHFGFKLTRVSDILELGVRHPCVEAETPKGLEIGAQFPNYPWCQHERQQGWRHGQLRPGTGRASCASDRRRSSKRVGISSFYPERRCPLALASCLLHVPLLRPCREGPP